MNELLRVLNHYMDLITFVTVLAAAFVAAFLYYLLRVRKVTAAEEKINYERFVRTSAMEYCKFRDVVSDDLGGELDGVGMIIYDEKTFVAGLSVQGYNFDHAPAGERQATMIGAVAFASILEQPVQMRQTLRAMDVGKNLEELTAVRARQARILAEKTKEYDDLCLQAEARKDDPEVLEALLAAMERLDALIFSVTWKIREADNLIEYEKRLREAPGQASRQNQILFSYIYNPEEHVEDLSGEEVIKKAMTALRSKMHVYADALSSCGCSAMPLTAREIMEEMYRHFHPATADVADAAEQIERARDSLFVTSSSLFDLEGEKRMEEMIRIYEEESDAHVLESVQKTSAIREAETARLKDAVKAYGDAYEKEVLHEPYGSDD